MNLICFELGQQRCSQVRLVTLGIKRHWHSTQFKFLVRLHYEKKNVAADDDADADIDAYDDVDEQMQDDEEGDTVMNWIYLFVRAIHPCTMHDRRCKMHDVKYTIPDARYTIHDTRYTMHYALYTNALCTIRIVYMHYVQLNAVISVPMVYKSNTLYFEFCTKAHNISTTVVQCTMYCTRVVQCADIFWEAQCCHCRSGRDECSQWPITVTFKGPSKPLLFLRLKF